MALFDGKKQKETRLQLDEEKRQLEKEKEEYRIAQIDFLKERDALRNAQILFQQQQALANELTEKDEKDILIDLYGKISKLESSLYFFQTNISSIDNKLEGVKDYSNDLESMSNEMHVLQNKYSDDLRVSREEMQENTASILNELNAVKDQTLSLHNTYKTQLNTIYEYLTQELNGISDKIQSTVSNIINIEMQKLSSDFSQQLSVFDIEFSKSNENQNTIFNKRMRDFERLFGEALNNMSNNVSKTVKETLSIEQINAQIRKTLKESLSNLSDNQNVIADKCRKILNEIEDNYSYNSLRLELSAIKDAIDDLEIEDYSSKLYDISSSIDEVKYKLDDL